MKSQIQNKKNGGIVELLIPTLNKIIKNQDTQFVVIMNNRLYSALKYGKIFYKKKTHEGTKTFLGKTIMGRLL